MKKIGLFILACGSFHSFSQSLTPTVVASAGDYFVGSSANLSWTLGEIAIDTYVGTNNQLTQGFQQPEISFSSIQDFAPEISVSLYPNPTQSAVNVQVNNTAETLQIYLVDLTGQVIYSEAYQSGTLQKIDLSYFADGTYLMHIVNSKNEKIETLKIQKL